jgi:hypothetical protein
MKTWMVAAFLLAGCGASSSSSTAQNPDPRKTWASRPECEQLVDHLEGIVLLDRGPNRPDIFQAANLNPANRQHRVDTCTITVTKKDHACLSAANDTRQLEECIKVM